MQRVVIGKNAVTEAIKSGNAVDKILILFGVKGKEIEKIKKYGKKKGIPSTEVNKQRFRDLVGDSTTQGILCLVNEKDYATLDECFKVSDDRKEKPFFLITDELSDPHNLGALSRTAEAVGVHGIIFPKHHSAGVNHTTSKISAGASEHMTFARVNNIAQTIEELKDKGVWIVGTDPLAEKNYSEVDYTLPIALVIGNEQKGVRKLIKEKCDFLVKIPMFGQINSLNASVAGAILLYEVARKRRGF